MLFYSGIVVTMDRLQCSVKGFSSVSATQNYFSSVFLYFVTAVLICKELRCL